MASNWSVAINMVADYSPIVKAEFARESKELAIALADRCTELAKQYAPVDTGKLRNSIHTVETGDYDAESVTEVEYAPFQEYGTVRNRATPFMTPAYLVTLSEVDKIAKQVYTL